MQLTFEQICNIATGAVSIHEAPDGIHLHRLTATQEKAFGDQSPFFLDRAYCTTGCTLDMITNSKSIELDITCGDKFEIYADQLMVKFVKPDKPQRIRCDLPDGTKRVTVVLPSHTVGIIRSVSLDDGASLLPYEHATKVLFLGDSITQGWEAEHDGYAYSHIVTRHLDAHMLNYGIGGSRFCDKTLEDVGFDADIVFIAYGTNDYTFFPSAQVLQEECSKFMDKVRQIYPSSKIFCISPIWRGRGHERCAAGTLDECRQIIIHEAQRRGIVHIDGYLLVPHTPEHFQEDLLHPNDLGFLVYGQNLLRHLQSYL